MDLNTLITECSAYDYKEMLEEKKPKSWLKSVSAFANTLGGSLFFGVDNDGNVKGLEDIQQVTETISMKIRDYMDPLPDVEMIPLEQEGKHVLADVMAQLDYMEKRGSGLKRICNETKALEAYKEDRRPVFKSSPSQFMTVIYSMEYDGGLNGQLNGQLNGDDRVNDRVNDSLSDSVNSTYQAIKANPGIQRKRISEMTGKSIPTIDRHIALLAKSNFIEHRDSDKTGGYYPVTKK